MALQKAKPNSTGGGKSRRMKRHVAKAAANKHRRAEDRSRTAEEPPVTPKPRSKSR